MNTPDTPAPAEILEEQPTGARGSNPAQTGLDASADREPCPVGGCAGGEAGLESPSTSDAGVSPWVRIGMLAAFAAVFGVVGWLAGPPRTTKAAQQNEQTLRQTLRQLDEVRLAKGKLQEQLTKADAKVQELTGQVTASQQMQDSQQQALQDYKTKSEQVAQELADVRAAQEPMAHELEQAKQASAVHQQQLDAAAKAGEVLNAQLADAQTKAQKLSQEHEGIVQQKAHLEDDLRSQKQAAERLNSLLDCLEVHQGHVNADSKPGQPDMPVTAKELVSAMGSPNMSSEKDRQVRMQWSNHQATVRGGVVEAIDGAPCSRGQLLSSGSHLPDALPPASTYRLPKSSPVAYSDLIELFGKPDAVEGTGRNFSASWAVGAWGRNAVATVANGVVTKFDGRAVDAEELCQLVRQRQAAYADKNDALARQCTACEAFYGEAKKCLAQEIAKDQDVQRREGLTLKNWAIGDFNTVNTWIAPTTFAPEAMTMRTTLTFTWESADGKTTTSRQYAVVTLAAQNAPVECVIFSGHDLAD